MKKIHGKAMKPSVLHEAPLRFAEGQDEVKDASKCPGISHEKRIQSVFTNSVAVFAVLGTVLPSGDGSGKSNSRTPYRQQVARFELTVHTVRAIQRIGDTRA